MTYLHIARIFVSVLGLAPIVGCGDEPGQFVIVQNQVPDQGCTVPGSRGDVYRGEGRLDVALVGDDAPVAYRLYPLLQNNLRKLDRPSEPNRLLLTSFTVEVEVDPAAPKAVIDVVAKADERLRSYEEPWSGTLDPGGSTLSAGVTSPLTGASASDGAFSSVTTGSVVYCFRMWATLVLPCGPATPTTARF